METREYVSLFLLSYDQSIDPSLCTVHGIGEGNGNMVKRHVSTGNDTVGFVGPTREIGQITDLGGEGLGEGGEGGDGFGNAKSAAQTDAGSGSRPHVIVCSYRPQSTWTSGRNQLAREMAYRETMDARRFKYWVFGDQDMATIEGCHPEVGCRSRPGHAPYSIEMAACCYDALVRALLAPEMQYATVNLVMYGRIPRTAELALGHLDCADGALNALHRGSVSVFLPYVELVDRLSWWESQATHWQIAIACVPGYSVFYNLFSVGAANEHGAYPRGRRLWESHASLVRVYGQAGLIPEPMAHWKVQHPMGNCLNWNEASLGAKFGASGGRHLYERPATLNATQSAGWQRQPIFHKCKQALRSRFVTFLATGDLAAIDGAPYAEAFRTPGQGS